ncbi:prominin-like protein isoform X3 [Toxorhynchites rutilus septentrionalis]|uniref:prominin-like protein isoform X3 n=1 Tax=Toxorhynchites rutilus septentrionalis TaxID=329112 RepID=UPI00247869A8|nr:prominin-like protein isoform X3 [Toxorhynchites rutilus septentrionalis]
MEGPSKDNCSTATRSKFQGCHNHHQRTISTPTDCIITSNNGCCNTSSQQIHKRHHSSSSPAEDMISTMRSWRRPRPLGGVLLSFAVLLLINVFSSSSSVLVRAENILKIHTTEFSNISERPHFVSSTSYNARGMAPLYNLTNQVIKLFVDSNPVPEGYLLVREGDIQLGPNVRENNWGPLLRQYWAVLLVTVICVLLIVLMPIIGLCLCCCRCFGGCGGRTQPFDKKHDTCRRVLMGLLLTCATSSLVFGVVVAYATNSYMQHGVENITVSARHGVDDTREFLRTTSRQISQLLDTNYQELNSQLRRTLNDASDIIIQRLEEESKAEKLNTLNDFVEQLPLIKENLDRMSNLTRELRVNASQLNDGLRGVKRELLASLTKCGTQECLNVMEDYKIGRLDTNGIDYNAIQDRYFPRLPDLSEITNNVQELVSGNIAQAVQKGVRELESLKQTLKRTVRESIPLVTAAADSTGQAIKSASDELTSKLNSVSNVVGNNSYRHLDTADDYIVRYSIYRYYVGLGVSSALLLILMCLVFGLLCGICGKRPDGYGDDCCNKGAGGRFLMFGVAIIFLTFSVILAFTLVSFLAGSIVRRGVCDSLRHPKDSQVIHFVDTFFNINEHYQRIHTQSTRSKGKLQGPNRQMDPIRIAEVIESCSGNNSIYEVLKLSNFYDIQEIRQFPEDYGIIRELNALKEKIQIDEVQILSPEAERDIEELKNSRLNDFEAYKFVDNLTQNITQNNLNDIANRLREVADKVPTGKEMNDIKVNLKNQALHLSSYQVNLVEPMLRYTTELVNLSVTLDTSLKFGKDSFALAIDDFLTHIQEAERYINENGQQFVEAVTHELTNGILDQIHSYLNLVIVSTSKEIGRCGPLANVYASMTVATCNRIVDPFNGFWAGVGWCLLIFLPIIVLCVKLSSLYQKSDPYPGPLVESGPKNKRRKKSDRRRDSRDRQVYYEDGSPSGGHSREPRYNDMAPNLEPQLPPILTNSSSNEHDFAVVLQESLEHTNSPPKTPSPIPSPNRLLSRLFQRSIFEDFQRKAEDGWEKNISRSNSSVGSVRSMAVLASRTPSPLDFRTVSFRRPRSLADDIGRSKRERRPPSAADSGYDRY